MLPSTVLHDYYAILGIPQSADPASIKSAYKRLALVKHPDRRRNEPKATAEFQLLNAAYEQLRDVDRRREYDRIYESTIRHQKIKNQKIAELDGELQKLKDERRGLEISLYNANKDLIRLHVERDSLKGEKERIMKERATEETWWLYLCSFMPGRAAAFTRQKQRRENMLLSIIGKRRAKDLNINLKTKDVQHFKEQIQTLSSKERSIEVERRRIEEEWRELCYQQDNLRMCPIMNQDSAAFMDGYKMAAVQLLDSFAAENPQVLFTMCIPDSSKRLCLPS
ncbi:hypothetical protein LV158_003591 [Aspergillus fumigatus]|nr:hypothetical protein LV158_003591 [Aspergillus fumigatus]